MLAQHPSPSRKHPPFVGQEGHRTSYLQLSGRLCTSPSSWYLKNQLLQHATCEPYSTFVPRLDCFFSVAPRYIGQDKAEGFLPNLYPTQNSQQQASLSLKKCMKKWEKCLYTPKAGKTKVGTYSPSPSTAAVVLCSTPFLETQQTAAKTVAGQRGRKGKMLLQNMQRLSYRLMGSQQLQASPAFTQYLKNLKAQYKSQILHYLEGSNTPSTASSHSGTCCTVSASNYWEPGTCKTIWITWDEHHL